MQKYLELHADGSKSIPWNNHDTMDTLHLFSMFGMLLILGLY